MRYEPIKDRISSIIGVNGTLRRLLYAVLGLVFLREWHVKRVLRRIIRSRRPKAILDAGSGFGQYAYYAAKKSRAVVVGVDINDSEIEKCNRFAAGRGMGNLSFKRADLEELKLAERFGLIISVDVMEHIRDDVRVFRNFRDVLEEGGQVVISTPSNFGGSDVHDEGEHSFIEEHFREGYSAEDIRTKLESAGFKIDQLRYTYGSAGSMYWRLAIKLPVTLLNKSFLFFVLLPFYYLVALPFSLLFMACDYLFPPKKGSGLLVVASRSGKTDLSTDKAGR